MGYVTTFHDALAHLPANENGDVMRQVKLGGLSVDLCKRNGRGVPVAWRVCSPASKYRAWIVDACERYLDVHFYALSRTSDRAGVISRAAPLSLIVDAAISFLSGPEAMKTLIPGGIFSVIPHQIDPRWWGPQESNA